jgi:hypothetical protein
MKRLIWVMATGLTETVHEVAEVPHLSRAA